MQYTAQRWCGHSNEEKNGLMDAIELSWSKGVVDE